MAVAAGTATTKQINRVRGGCVGVFVDVSVTASLQVRVTKRCTRNYNDMMALLSGLRALDTNAFDEVPDQFKQGLKCHDHFNRVRMNCTREKIDARIAEIATEGWQFAAYSNEQFSELLDALIPRVQIILLCNMVTWFCSALLLDKKITHAQAYIGFTWRSGAGFEEEISPWALSNSTAAVQRKDGALIRSWADLEAMGFGVRVTLCVLTLTLITHIITGASTSSQRICVQLQDYRDGAPSRVRTDCGKKRAQAATVSKKKTFGYAAMLSCNMCKILFHSVCHSFNRTTHSSAHCICAALPR